MSAELVIFKAPRFAEALVIPRVAALASDSRGRVSDLPGARPGVVGITHHRAWMSAVVALDQVLGGDNVATVAGGNNIHLLHVATAQDRRLALVISAYGGLVSFADSWAPETWPALDPHGVFRRTNWQQDGQPIIAIDLPALYKHLIQV